MKTAVFDNKIIVIGSTNWTTTAEYVNDENLLVIENSELSQKLTNEFNRLWHTIPDKYLTEKASKEHFKHK